MKEYTHRCEARIQARDRHERIHPRTCSNGGVVERDDKWFCKLHDPVAIKQKDEAKNVEQEMAHKAFQEQIHRISAENKACKDIPTKALEEGIIQEMITVCNNLQQDNSLWSLELRKAEAKAILNKLKEN
jgi:hypothetical protein